MYEHDVLIIGGGLAGLRAAVEVTRAGVDVAVISKVHPVRSHSNAAQGGINAPLTDRGDDWQGHAYDTIKGSDFLADQDAVEVMAKEAIGAVLDLEKMGLPFNRTPEGKIDQRRFGGHTRDHGKAPVRRACYAADRTGHMILQTLYQNCVKHNVEFYNEFYALDLCLTETENGPVATGIIAYELATGELHIFHAKSIVFATGGSGRIYKTTSNAHTLTGDGMSNVFRKGLPPEDMEFHQFHPTGLAGLGILISEAVRGEGGILRNEDGERFMERYAPTIKDLAPRDIVARSMVLEVLEGRGKGLHRLGVAHVERSEFKIRQVFVVVARPAPRSRDMHPSTGVAKISRDRQTDAPRASGDEHPAALEVEPHLRINHVSPRRVSQNVQSRSRSASAGRRGPRQNPPSDRRRPGRVHPADSTPCRHRVPGQFEDPLHRPDVVCHELVEEHVDRLGRREQLAVPDAAARRMA